MNISGMKQIELTEKTRSDRKPWKWTDLNVSRADDISSIFNELRRWWPLTERQAYYRLISSPLSKQAHWHQFGYSDRPGVNIYKTIGRTLKWMRINEKLPWNAIIDEHRVTTPKLGFENKEEYIEYKMDTLFEGYGRCMAQKQGYYLELWIEKAALLHIVKPIADAFCRRVVVCKGYNSITFQADFYNRATEAISMAQTPAVLYFGDWDPSGVNMIHAAIQTLQDELDLFGVEYYRCGINPDQFGDIPADPIPIKPSDSRAKKFIEQHGTMAYELDAFHPVQLEALVGRSIETFTDMEAYEANAEREIEDWDELDKLKQYVIDGIQDYDG